MRTIAILNLKGGVAKTVTTINTAHILAARHGQRVLVIDGDSQCNATEFLQRDALHFVTLADMLRGSTDNAVERSRIEGVWLVPGDEALMDLDLTKVENGAVSSSCIKDLARGFENSFDYVLIDCPPAFNAASCAALVAADEVVIPLKLDAFSLRGMANIMRQIRNMQKINPKLRVAGLLPTMFYNSPKIREAERQLRDSGLPVFSHIRRTPKVDDMTFEQEPILVSSPTSAAAADYLKFVDELIGGVDNGI